VLTKAIRQKGAIVAELATATALLGLLIVGMTVSLSGFAKFNRYQWTRQRCLAAAQAQLDSLIVTGRPIEPEEIRRLWSEVTVAVERTPGAGAWDGLELVQVTATGRPAGARAATVRLARYVFKGD
jgi:hypothetical protein